MILKRILVFIAALAPLQLSAHAASLSDAFSAGATFGRTGNAAARGQLTGDSARSTVPHFTTTPPEASYFGSPGLAAPAAVKVGACASSPGATGASTDPACNAVEFSQTNPARRPSYSIGPTDPLLTRAKTITADPASIAGSLTGTYSGCSVQTATTPDIFETLICHQYRRVEQVICQKLRTVQVSWHDSCPVGTPFASTFVNTWGNGQVGVRYAGVVIQAYCHAGDTVRMTLHAICTEEPCSGYAELEVNASNGFPSPQVFTNFIGRSWYATDIFNRVDYRGGACTAEHCSFDFCTLYDEWATACDGTTGTCMTDTFGEVRACGTFHFARARSIATITDAWDNQCAMFEARLP